MIALVVLAAGHQTRFGGDTPKCLYEVGGESIVEALANQYDLPTILVASKEHSEEMETCAAKNGWGIAYPDSENIGSSVAAGMRTAEKLGYRSSVVVSADTLVCGDDVYIPGIGEAYFDPWKWVTIWRVLNNQYWRNMVYDIQDRVEFMALGLWRVCLVDTGWYNVNTKVDLHKGMRRYVYRLTDSN